MKCSDPGCMVRTLGCDINALLGNEQSIFKGRRVANLGFNKIIF